MWYNQEKLVLFVVSRGASAKERVLEELQQRLPSHAVPDLLVPVDSLPLTSHGKAAPFLAGVVIVRVISVGSDAGVRRGPACGRCSVW